MSTGLKQKLDYEDYARIPPDGKRYELLEGDLFVVIHLMIAGRLHWKDAGAKIPAKVGLAAFDFETGTLTLTEAGTKRRASLHLLRGEAALREQDPGGIDVVTSSLPRFREVLTRESLARMRQGQAQS